MRKVVLILGMLSLLLLSGCGTLQTLLQGESDIPAWIGDSDLNTKENSASSAVSGATTVMLFFADETGKYLVKEERTLPKTLSIARETVSQWLKGPAIKSGTVQALVTPATNLIDIALKDGVATIDLSKEFLLSYGDISKELAVYGLVNTVTQFSTVEEVKLRIDGKSVSKVGNIDVTHLAYRADLLKGIPAAVMDDPTDLSPGLEENTDTAQTLSPSKVNLFGGISKST